MSHKRGKRSWYKVAANDSSDTSIDNRGQGYFHLPAEAAGGLYGQTTPFMARFRVAAGRHTYYLVSQGTPDAGLKMARMQAIFMPN